MPIITAQNENACNFVCFVCLYSRYSVSFTCNNTERRTFISGSKAAARAWTKPSQWVLARSPTYGASNQGKLLEVMVMAGVGNGGGGVGRGVETRERGYIVKLEALIQWKQLMCLVLVLNCCSIIHPHEYFAGHTSVSAFERLKNFSSVFQT